MSTRRAVLSRRVAFAIALLLLAAALLALVPLDGVSAVESAHLQNV